MPFITAVGIGIFVLLLSSTHANAQNEVLPYDGRSRSFTGMPSTLRGDKLTMGMGGATTGLGDTLLGALDNPAGLAMTLPGTTLQGATNFVYDDHTQNFDSQMNSPLFAVGGPAYPWGFSLAIWTPYTEGKVYTLNDLSDDVNVKVRTRDLRLSVARLFFKHKLSLGVGLSFATATRAVFPDGSPNNVESLASSRFGITGGALLQLPHRWLLGLAYQTPLTFSGRSGGSTLIPDFFQSVHIPSRLSLGLGYIPNRFFRVGMSVVRFGRSPANTALIRDENVLIGQKVSYQIRLGARYHMLEYRHFNADLSIGTYLEQSRMSNHSFRPHLTGGLGISAWILDAGFSIDFANKFVNYTISYGINFINAARFLGLVKPSSQTYYMGAFPSMLREHEFGLPRPLVKNRYNQGRGTDLIKMGRDIRRNVDKGLNTIEDLVTDDENEEKIDADNKPKLKTRTKPRSRPDSTKRRKKRNSLR